MKILTLILVSLLCGCVSRAKYDRDLRLMSCRCDQTREFIASMQDGQDDQSDIEKRIERLERIISEEAREREERSMGSNRFKDAAEEAGKRTDEHLKQSKERTEMQRRNFEKMLDDVEAGR
jgi:hypothetical protein